MYITGLHAIEEYLQRPDPEGELYVCGGGRRIEAIRRLAGSRGMPVHRLTREELAGRTGIPDSKGVVLSIPKSPGKAPGDIETLIASLVSDSALIVCLDGITDPQNLGAIIRSAEQFGADCVVMPKRRSAGITDTVARVSSGAVEYIPVFSVQNMARTLEYLKKNGFWVFGADAAGVSILDSDFRGRVAVILGSEGSGMSRLVRDNCDALVSIPTTGHIDSLNVSVAAGILMYEIRRRQNCL